MTASRYLRATIGLLCGAALAAGCSSSSAGHGSTGTPASASPTSSAPATSSPAPSSSSGALATSGSSQAAGLLSALALRASDLPSGWTPRTANTSGDDAAQAAIVACVGGRNTRPDRLERVATGFTRGDTEANGTVSRFKSQSDVTSDVALIRNPKIDRCYAAAARKQLETSKPSGAKIGAVAVHIARPPSGSPPNVVGVGTARITLTASSGQRVTVYSDVVFIVGPRLQADVTFTAVGAPVSPALRNHAVAAVAARVAHG